MVDLARIGWDVTLAHQGFGGRAGKVVVVEDEAQIRDLELSLLEAEGWQGIGVPDGVAAAETIRRERADLVILDLMLPGKDGNTVLMELGRDPATANVPVIVVSAFGGTLKRTPQVKQVIPKPFDIGDLLQAVERHLNPR